ncbi:MAG: carbon-nitrogen family hydrolase [Firmicutes bacterium]|nr:carbon-nitrogen family hydrolase [Bacillota bacterium]
MESLNVIAIQVGCGPDRRDNLARALSLLRRALQHYRRVDAVVLPELFYVMPEDLADNDAAAELAAGLSKAASENGVWIVGGTVPQRVAGGKTRNYCMVFDPHGSNVAGYCKTHLFDALDYAESETTEPGEGLITFDIGEVKAGVIVCYELRFPEIIRTLTLKGIRVLFVPSAFMSPRHDHWDTLIRSAALQNQIYVVAANQLGRYGKHVFFGRSMVADPWGIVVAQASDHETFVGAALDFDYQDSVRSRLPVFKHRRPDLYSV